METISIDKEQKKVILSVDFDELISFSSAFSASSCHYLERFCNSSDALNTDVYRNICDKHSQLSFLFRSLYFKCENVQK